MFYFADYTRFQFLKRLFTKGVISRLTFALIICFGTCFVYAQNVYIQDINFKNYLINQNDINTNGDKEIQLNEANSFRGAIDCSKLSIIDLQGIESFKYLTVLNCSQNNLKSLNLSKNTSLIELTCAANQLKSLDLSNNLSIEVIACGFNFIESLNISKNLNLQYLYCHRNLLNVLDVSKNIKLMDLTCWGNQLTELNISNNIALTDLSCGSNRITSLDLTKNIKLTSLGCEENKITELDVSKNPLLEFLFCDLNQFYCVKGVSKNCELSGSERCETMNKNLPKIGELTDYRDGKVYKTIRIGSQTWMSNNINVNRFRNGDLIPEAKSNEDWQNAGINQQPAWCYLNNDSIKGKESGRLYNWYALNDPRGLAPEGWIIPSVEHWVNLTDALGGIIISNDLTQMRYIEKYPIDFQMNDRGYRNDEGIFDSEESGVWWSDGDGENAFANFDYEVSDEILINPKINKYNTNVYFFCVPNSGFYVRCVKDKTTDNETINVETEVNNLYNIGYVNSKKLLDTLASYQDAEKKLVKMRAEEIAKYQILEKTFQAEYNRLLKKAPEMPKLILEQEQQKLKVKQQELENFEPEMTRKLRMYRQQYMEPILERTQMAIGIIAERRKLNYIFDETDLLYFKDGIDCTTEIMLELLKLETAMKKE
jgi:uncharacterized protein (TIGR02145 family)